MNTTITRFGRRLRLGVIGGGPGSFIGPVHRAAARLEDHYEIVAGVLSSNAERSRRYGRDIGLVEDRAYGSAAGMLAAEAKRGDGIDAVAIMTPNDSHCALSHAALDAGLDIICDKPLATNLKDAIALARRVKGAGLVFCQTFNYTGFPMVRQARAMVRDGDIGEIRMVQVEYVQGHAATIMDGERGDPPKDWHFRPEMVGPSLILGDIGSHAHHMATFVTGQPFGKLMADVGAVVPERKADDNAAILFRLENGAPGTMWVTQAGAGAVHGLKFRVFGATGGLEWHQEEPNQLRHSRLGAPALTFERHGPGLKPEALRAGRVGIGHPEGYQEAFAVLYADAAEAIVARRLGINRDHLTLDMPTVEDGVRTMKFIEAALESSGKGGWADCRIEI
ncbi:Predicted dehydrogenase [Rhizobiales bacterium GAS191]|nr:Predicted dehydrogenase [Rhizobiales bacterium GAS191]